MNNVFNNLSHESIAAGKLHCTSGFHASSVSLSYRTSLFLCGVSVQGWGRIHKQTVMMIGVRECGVIENVMIDLDIDLVHVYRLPIRGRVGWVFT